MTLETNRAYAEKFAKDHLVECVTELLKWQDTGVLADGKVRELQALCHWSGQASLRVAQTFVERAAYEKIFDDAFNSPEIQARRKEFLEEFYSEDNIGGHT